MLHATIRRPALLGHRDTFARQAMRIDEQARDAGLFDLPMELDGLHGHTVAERKVVRAMQMLGEAYGLHGPALDEWHWLFAFDAPLKPDGLLVREWLDVLPDLLLRVQTLAQYHDRAGKGRVWMQAWHRARPLRALGDVLAHAPHLAWVMVVALGDGEGALPMRGLRDLRRWLMTRHGLTAAGWRWLACNPPVLECSPSLFDAGAVGFAACMADLFGEVGSAFAPHLIFGQHAYWLVAQARAAEPQRTWPWLLTAAWAHCKSIDDKAGLEYFLMTSFDPLKRWVVRTGWLPDANQRRAGWPAFERAWQRDIGGASMPYMDWAIPFESAEHAGLVAHAIDNSHWLQAEGKAMGHCIADFLPQAVADLFMPFTVRGAGGERVATLSLTRASVDQPWALDQCKGKYNREVVEPTVHALALAVLASTNAIRPSVTHLDMSQRQGNGDMFD